MAWIIREFMLSMWGNQLKLPKGAVPLSVILLEGKEPSLSVAIDLDVTEEEYRYFYVSDYNTPLPAAYIPYLDGESNCLGLLSGNAKFIGTVSETVYGVILKPDGSEQQDPIHCVSHVFEINVKQESSEILKD